MHPIDSAILKKANQEAIYTLYTYLADKTTPAEGDSLRAIVAGLEAALREQPANWTPRDILRLQILKNAVMRDEVLANSRIGDLTRSKSGLTAASFTAPGGEVSVVFRGTGSGEWIDNGEGLSGIPEENIYILYDQNGRETARRIVRNDHATDQQVEALNWFRRIAAQNGWTDQTAITLAGHSKGGNKAQFVTLHSDLVDAGYSFDGQGFSPEALAAFQRQYGTAFNTRRQKIYSFSADNDYVNVLGERLMPPQNIYYLESLGGWHALGSILDDTGRLRPMREQGELSRYVESVSRELMRIDPSVRQYATLGVMNLFQRYLGRGMPVNGDAVSIDTTIAGIGVAIGPLLRNLGSSNSRDNA